MRKKIGTFLKDKSILLNVKKDVSEKSADRAVNEANCMSDLFTNYQGGNFLYCSLVMASLTHVFKMCF